jgi:hypothetical protein
VPIKDYCKQYCSIRQAQIEATEGGKWLLIKID